MLIVSDNIRKCAEHASLSTERARARVQIGPAAVYVKNFFEKFKKGIDKQDSILYNIGVMRKENKTMLNFYFVDDATGEDFIVEADTLRDAIHIASAYFEDPQFLREISDYEAEMIGVDTY